MILVIFTVVFLVAAFLPSLWVRYVMRRHATERPDLPGTGGALAKHLVEKFQLSGVVVEETTPGNDHYDPAATAVRLSPDNYHGKSLTAVAVAAHEVGHAIQFARNEPISRLRSQFIPMAMAFKKAGVLILMAMPFLAIIVRAPSALLVLALISIALQLIGALAYLIVLPEEWDASFNKALPLLNDGQYVNEHDIRVIRQVLKAAALTYFAGALAEILNIGRWLLVLRR
jgi:Zn-dependent membrane protease YugP